MESVPARRETKYRLLINTISIIVPLAVALLLGFPYRLNFGDWTKILPHFIGAINTLTTLALAAGLIFIKQKSIRSHRIAMTTAFTLGGFFLVCYVTYHISNPANKFGSEDSFVRSIYFFFLITHVGLSLVVLPLVLRAMFYAVTGQFARHKRLVRYAFPVWLYVSVTGVIVYLMLYQLFPQK